MLGRLCYDTVSHPFVCLFVYLSLTLRYVFHTGWNSADFSYLFWGQCYSSC